MGGLAAAIELAARGADVTLVERQPRVGGKMRELEVAGRAIDSGPTVLTMRWVFEELFRAAGATLEERVRLHTLDVLARHAWGPDERLDLFRDRQRSAEAIAAFAGPAEGRGYLAFCEEAKRVFDAVERPVMLSPRPDMMAVAIRSGFSLDRVKAFTTMWKAIHRHFRDERLVQLFARYATYVGSSPYLAPGTLVLIAHVEQEGVWAVDGGMYRLAEAMVRLAGETGVKVRPATTARRILVRDGRVRGLVVVPADAEDDPRETVEEAIAADAVVVNADTAAVANGLLGEKVMPAVKPIAEEERSLSAVALSLVARPEGLPLARHTVFFSRDYRGEFDEIVRQRRLPSDPTVYVCAQDRLEPPAGIEAQETAAADEPMLMLVNAPANGDSHRYDEDELSRCHQATFRQLRRCGLTVVPAEDAIRTTDPAAFDRLFPASGGALYGKANHTTMASMERPTPRTRIPGLYLAGGSAHPGAGVPMATLSGRMAAHCLAEDLGSTRRSSRGVTFGGTSTG